MTRVAILILLIFVALLALRLLRVLVEAFWKAGARRGSPPRGLEGEMVRDPVCGTWIDRRLALAARNGGGWVPVCSEACRARLQGA